VEMKACSSSLHLLGLPQTNELLLLKTTPQVTLAALPPRHNAVPDHPGWSALQLPGLQCRCGLTGGGGLLPLPASPRRCNLSDTPQPLLL